MTKKRIALDISSTKSDHRFRGIGFYTLNLWQNLKKIAEHDSELELVTFNKQIPSADLYHFPAFNPFFMSFPPNLINKSILTIHDLIPIEFPYHYPSGIKGRLRWNIQKYLIKKSAGIITDSQSSADSIFKLTAYPKSKTHVIYLAADEQFRPISRRQNIFSDANIKKNLPERFALYVGDLNWNKNIMLLAKSCVELNIPLVVVSKQSLNTEIDSKHPWNKSLVEFQDYAAMHPDLIARLGFVSLSDLTALYNLALVYVQPSIAEGFGFPVLEAMACGCLVLSSDKTSLPEIGGEAVLYFDPYSEKELKKQLSYIWDASNSAALEKYKDKAVKRAAQFSWHKTALETWNLYKNIIL